MPSRGHAPSATSTRSCVHSSQPSHPRKNPAKRFAIAAACLALIGCGVAFALQGGSSGGSDTHTQMTADAGMYAQDALQEAVVYSYEPTVASIAEVPESSEPTAFDLTDNPDAFTLSEASADAIDKALSPFAEDGINLGFVVLDVRNGHGISYNPDQEVYGASTIKAPFSTYVLQDLVESGEVDLSGKCADYNENLVASGTTTVKNQISDAITWSSNGAFAGLRKTFGGSDYADWLRSLGVDPSIHDGERYFAWYTPRDAAKLWMNTYLYLGQETETSNWLKGLLSRTNRSPIREGVAASENVAEGPDGNGYVLVEESPSTQGGEEVTDVLEASSASDAGYAISEGDSKGGQQIAVGQAEESAEDDVSGDGPDDRMSDNDGKSYRVSDSTSEKSISIANKAGWLSGSPSSNGRNYNSLCDNGVLSIGETDYIFCVMTSARDNDKNNARLVALISALFDACDELDLPVEA